ncbi:MAG: radical SAM protein [Bacteroidales bacterium]|jgi:wyosine [tRNA(Phe)-imidazoG37] synthetase (radical SAM superfamily)|nr:radical SAM protein [Bacteroidales bacterium]
MITFGPVPSRRLGRSLGINNIVRPKVCPYNCIYCQVGQTRHLSHKREEFFTPDQIFAETEKHLEKLKSGEQPDYLTFVSNGEPTLDINLGTTIHKLRVFGIPLAVITNSSLLHEPDVRSALMTADWVSVKADVADNETWRRINRPAEGLDFERMIEGMTVFAADYRGELRTETMLCSGINDSIENIKAVASLVSSLVPGKAYISIPTRPPSELSVTAPEEETVNMAWQVFKETGIETELLTGFEGTRTGFTGNIYEDILNITAVHPLREDALMELLARNHADFAVMESLLGQKLIRQTVYRGRTFYLRSFHLK